VALRVRSAAPSGIFGGEMRFQGLNPWAESYNPLAAQAAGTTLDT
jgi:hypothetical protein